MKGPTTTFFLSFFPGRSARISLEVMAGGPSALVKKNTEELRESERKFEEKDV